MQLHAGFQIFGVVYIAHNAARFLRQLWEEKHHIYGLVSWAGRSTPPKIEIFLEYGLLLTIVSAVILALFTYIQRNKESIEFTPLTWAIFGTYEFACLLFSFSTFWILLSALFPVWLYSRNLPQRSEFAERISLTLSFGAIAGALLVLSLTSWKADVYVLNDYLDLPEYTRMEDGRIIENSEYMRNNLIGKYDEIDICNSSTINKTTSLCLHLSNKVFRSVDDAFILFPPGTGAHYDWGKETLVIKNPLTEKQNLLIESLWGAKSYGDDQLIEWKETANNEEFVMKNSRSFKPATYMGGEINNHSDLYLSSLTAIASRQSHGTMFFYGTGLTTSLASLLSMTAASTYNDYFVIYMWAIYAYLLLLALVVWRITHNPWAVAIALITVEIFAGNSNIRSIPQLNPILHFPDLICLLTVAYDARRRSIISAFTRALAIGFMIWWNQEFGILLLAASIIWHLLEASSANGNWKAIYAKLGLESLIASMVIVGVNIMSANHQMNTLSIGIYSQLENWRQIIFLILLVVTLIWMRFMGNSSNPQPKRHVLDVAGIGAIYATLAGIFLLADNGASYDVFLTVIPITILTWILDKRITNSVATPRLMSYITYLLIIFSAGILAVSYASHRQLLSNNENHKNFVWKFPRLIASSTAEPQLMQKSVNLIKKYQPEGRLQIISKYDNWLRVLTGRPDYFTYIDWRTAVVSHEMINKTAALINQSNIPILFVDYKLLENSGNNVGFDPTNAISAMSQVFRKILPCYTPGEIDGLLQVWHRSCGVK